MNLELKSYDGDVEKLRQLILYVSQKCAEHSEFGSTKLNKILYFSDFLSYANTGKPLTGVEYQRLKWGPAPRCMKPVMDQMCEKHELGIQKTVTFSGEYTTHKPVNLASPDLRLFTAEEISIVDDVIEKQKDLHAFVVSEFSHVWGGVEVC